MKPKTYLSLALSILLCLISNAAQAITLTKDGQPAATIVIRQSALAAKAYTPDYPKNINDAAPDTKVRRAADDLQSYVEKISGAKLPIAGDNEDIQGPVILVGVSKRTDAMKLDIPHGETKERKEEGYIIVCKGDTLVLAGNEDHQYWGTYYAVAEFLYRLGMRWFMPTDFGEIIPSLKTISFDNVEFRDKPAFILRNWSAYIPYPMINAEMLWKLRNKMQIFALLPAAGDSSIRYYMPNKAMVKAHPECFPKDTDSTVDLFKIHPEYFARNADGTPDPFDPNLTNPDVPKLVAQRMKDHCKAEKEKNGFPPVAIACAPDDGMPVDYNPATVKINNNFTEIVGREGVATDVSVSEEWFAFINKVAEELAKDYPDVMIATNGYANRNLPPEGVKLHPNLMILYASIWADTLKALDNPRSWHSAIQGATLKRWCELNPRVNLYRYVYTMLGTSLAPVPTVRKMAHDYPLYKKWGVIGFIDEQKGADYMEQGITTFYLRTRLNWDADLNVKAELDDYFDKWYGKAAEPSRAFWEALEECMETTPFLGHEERILPNVYTPGLVTTLEKNVASAEKLADTDRVKTHVEIDRHILEHLKYYLAMWEAEFSANYAEAVKQCNLMATERAKLHDLCPFLNMPEMTFEDGMARYYSGTWGASLRTWKIPFYQNLADKISGKTGTLIAMGDRKVKFALDEADKGKPLRWHAPDFDRDNWLTIDTTKPFYSQVPGCYSKDGVPYRGLMWYVFDMDVPNSAKGKPVTLYTPAVVAEAWVWINGHYAGHRPWIEPNDHPAPMELDVTNLLQPGKKNVVAVRVSTGTNRSQAAEGFFGRLFLYSRMAPAQ